MIDPAPAIGHNSGAADLLLEQAAERTAAANEWLAKVKEIADADQAAKLSTFIDQVQGTFAALNARRLQEGREFRAKQDAVYEAPLSLLMLSKDALTALRKNWLAREQARVDAEKAKAAEAAREAAAEAEAARRKAEASTSVHAKLAAQEAEEKAQAASRAAEDAPTKARIDASAHGGRTVAVTTRWHARITSISTALKSYAKEPSVIAAIEEAILRLARKEATAAKDPTKARPGTEFYSTTD